MAFVQYKTNVEWDSEISDVGFVDNYTLDPVSGIGGLAISANKITTGAPAATAGHWLPSALIQNIVDGTTYEMTGTTASPAWTILAAGSSGITQLTGDVTAGPGVGSQVATIAAGVIVNADVNASAAIDYSKLAALPSGEVLVGSAGNVATAVAVSKDATMINTGALTVVGIQGVTVIAGPYTAGDMLFYDGTFWQVLPAGVANNGKVLTVVAGVPAWV